MPASQATSLGKDEIHIYISKLDHPVNEINQYRELLTQEELSKAARYLLPSRQNTFILSRGKLRAHLAHYTSLPAKHIEFIYSKNQKPFISEKQNSTNPVYFNISHSHNYILHAFARTSILGIDIEYKSNERPFAALAERFYTATENQQFHNSKNKLEIFYRLWVLKEAYLKSQGIGLSGGLKNIEFTLGSNHQLPVLKILRHSGENKKLHAQELLIHPDYQSALICDLEHPRVLLFYDLPG